MWGHAVFVFVIRYYYVISFLVFVFLFWCFSVFDIGVFDIFLLGSVRTYVLTNLGDSVSMPLLTWKQVRQVAFVFPALTLRELSDPYTLETQVSYPYGGEASPQERCHYWMI